MKNTISILTNTNKCITSTSQDFGAVREGSYLRIGNDAAFYTIAKTQPVFYIKDFTVLDRKNIQVNGDFGLNVLNGDVLTLSYKEYTLNTVLDIKGGKGYKIDDILLIEDGDPAIDNTTGLKQFTKIRVSEVGEKDEIINIGILDNGKYITPPNKKVKVGENAEFELDYQVKEDRQVIEKPADKVTIDNNTIIRLAYELPKGLKEGKLSVKKWEIILTSNYVGNTQLNVSYEISRDFTSFLKLPLPVSNSLNTQLIVRQGFQMLDNKIKQLTDEINELKKKLGSSCVCK